MAQRTPAVNDQKHLAFIRTLPCLATLVDHQTEAAHVRGNFNGNRPMGMQERDDRYVVPLCSAVHRKQHQQNEHEFWEKLNINPAEIAEELYQNSGDYNLCRKIITSAHLKRHGLNGF